MNLTRKFILALTLAMLGVLALSAAIRIRRDLRRFDSQRRASNHLLGRAVAGAASRIWATVGLKQALDLVADANERESAISLRWVWLDASAGDPHAPDLDVERVRALAPSADVRARTPSGRAVYTYESIPGGRPAALELKQSLADEEAHVRDALLQAVLVTLALAVVCGLLIAALVHLLIGRPMRLLVEKARRVGRGDLTGDLHLPQRDEVSELAGEMNRMCARLAEMQLRASQETEARLQALDQLRHADRLTTVGRLGAGLAHELGTPLNVISGRAEIVLRTGVDQSPLVQSSARVILDQAAKMTDILHQLLDFARRRPAQKLATHLASVTRQAVMLLDALARKRGVRLSLEEGRDAEVHVDAAQMQQALANLIVNAIDAMPAGGAVTVSVGREHARAPADAGGIEADCARIDVVDRGEGIAPETLPHIFEPFFTTKKVGEGTGLGLSVAYGIVKEHKGWIQVDSAPGNGSRFSIFLPAEAA
ncbi:MAG TPA: HAMP domain-containing sensor histidine kinase [Myxococcales bacterium]|nr:HAMP domain-containing sensor histidine kinase [Myxococcales bacterium]